MHRFRQSSVSEAQQQRPSLPERDQRSTSAPRPNSSQVQPPRSSGSPRPLQQNMPPPTLHDMARIVSLFNPAPPDERKLYCAGYLWQRVELLPNGKQPSPKSPEAHWTKWYVQLSGGELSLWSVEKMQQAVAEGRTVGPTFLKLTDVFVSAVDTKTIPPGGRPPPQCEWVFSLHNAVSNRILFAPEEDKQSGQTTLDALKMWINCIRLCEWEIYKLNNIFTGTLVGLRDPQAQRSPLVKGRLEDWVQVRIPGDAEWRKAYLVVSDGTAPAKSKRRLSSFMSLSSSQSHNLNEHGQSGPSACFYANKRSKKPFLTYTRVNVAQAVFPEAEQLISSTAVAKVEGTFEWDKSDFPETPEGLQVNEKISLAKLASGKGEDHAATMIMPDPDSAPQDRQGAMLAWVLAFADVFGLFGRKPPYYTTSWDPRMPESPYFAYPVGPSRSRLYFDVPMVAHLEPWSSSPATIHKTFDDMLANRMRQGPSSKGSPGPQQQQQQPQRPMSGQALKSSREQNQPQPRGGPPQQPHRSQPLPQPSGPAQAEVPPQPDTYRRDVASPPTQTSQPPRLEPVIGSGSMDMDSYLARSPGTGQPGQGGSASQGMPKPTSQPQGETAKAGKPKLAALQTSDAALHPDRKVNGAAAAAAPAPARAPAQEPSDSMLPYDRQDAEPAPSQSVQGSSKRPAHPQHVLPTPPDQDTKQTESRNPSAGPDTLASAYSQPSVEHTPASRSFPPPQTEVKPLFSPNTVLPQNRPGSLGIMSPAPEADQRSETTGERGTHAHRELPTRPPPPEKPASPSPNLPIPGALPASQPHSVPTSQHASIYGDSGTSSAQPSSSPNVGEAAIATASSSHVPDSSSGPIAQQEQTRENEPQSRHAGEQSLQRQVSSNNGHGLDDYASLALSYMNMAPPVDDQQHHLSQQQKGKGRLQDTENTNTASSEVGHNGSALPETATMSPTSPDRYAAPSPPPQNASTVPTLSVAAPKGPKPSTFGKAKADERALAAEKTKTSHGQNLYKPGRPNGNVPKGENKMGASWASDEESQDSEDSEEDSDQDRRPARSPQPQGPRMSVDPADSNNSPASREVPLNNLKSSTSSANTPATYLGLSQGAPSQHPERRASRSLPVPPGRNHAMERTPSSEHTPPRSEHQRSSSSSPEAYRQPIPRSPSGMNRLQQLHLGDDERPKSQNRMSHLSQAHSSSTSDFQQRPVSQIQGSPRNYTQNPDDLTGVAGFTTDGMLQTGLKNKHDRSAKEREAMARESGAPLVDVGTSSEKQRDMQTSGMVAAIAERERSRQRDGGQGAAARKQADADFVQHHNQFSHGPSPSQSGDFSQQGSQYFNPMFNPYMNMGMPGMGMQPGFHPQQFMLQQQAMMAAQQAYMNTMMAMSSPQMSSPSSPAMNAPPSPAPGHASQMSMGGQSPQMSMYGAPQGWGNPYMMGSMSGMSGMFPQQQQQQPPHSQAPPQSELQRSQHAWSSGSGSQRGFSPVQDH